MSSREVISPLQAAHLHVASIYPAAERQSPYLPLSSGGGVALTPGSVFSRRDGGWGTTEPGQGHLPRVFTLPQLDMLLQCSSQQVNMGWAPPGAEMVVSNPTPQLLITSKKSPPRGVSNLEQLLFPPELQVWCCPDWEHPSKGQVT